MCTAAILLMLVLILMLVMWKCLDLNKYYSLRTHSSLFPSYVSLNLAQQTIFIWHFIPVLYQAHTYTYHSSTGPISCKRKSGRGTRVISFNWWHNSSIYQCHVWCENVKMVHITLCSTGATVAAGLECIDKISWATVSVPPWSPYCRHEEFKAVCPFMNTVLLQDFRRVTSPYM